MATSGFRVKFIGSEEAMKAIDKKRSAIMAELVKEGEQIGFKIRGDAKMNLESRPLPASADTRLPARTRTNSLSQAITSVVATVGSGVSVVVGVLATVAYGRIQELGGTTSPHLIRPRYRKSLRFVSRGFIGAIRLTKGGKISRQQGSGLTFSMLVKHPGSRIPANPYLAPAVQNNRSFIQARWEAALKRGLAS